MSTLSREFIIETMHVSAHKGAEMRRAQAVLLTLAIQHPTCTAADLPGELTNGSKSLAGCASGALIAMKLLECVGRVKSPHKDAKGRKLNVLRIKEGRLNAALSWLARNGMPIPHKQFELTLEPAVV